MFSIVRVRFGVFIFATNLNQLMCMVIAWNIYSIKGEALTWALYSKILTKFLHRIGLMMVDFIDCEQRDVVARPIIFDHSS